MLVKQKIPSLPRNFFIIDIFEMLHKVKFQNSIYNVSLQKRTTKKPQKNKKKKKKKKRSKPSIAVLEEVVKISGIIFESHQRVSSV